MKSLKTMVGKLPRRLGRTVKAPARFPHDYPTSPKPDVTGETIFDDRPLRFRSHTLSRVDPNALEHPAGIDGAFKIRLASLPGTSRHAGVLVERRYQDRGYQIPTAAADPSLFTFLAYDEGKIVGTVGVRLDSPRGLSADDLYQKEIDPLRRGGRHFCEFTRLAVDATSASKPVLAGLFHIAYLYASVMRNCTHALIEVNPRHVAFYRRALKFEAIGPERMNKRVMAPAVLLCVPFATIADGVARFAGQHDDPAAKNSLFVYGFSRAEELGVLERLRVLAELR